MAIERDIKILHTAFLSSKGISTDTRTLCKDQLFFALSGENFDGNTFVEKALQKGCKLAICSDEDRMGQENVFVVPDPLLALQDLAHFHRKSKSAKILALTGSNGKTTTKELIASVLGQSLKLIFTEGNLNNHIGVPLTLLRLKDEALAIVEMGANHQGEIMRLMELAAPDMGLITNIGSAHLEGFGGKEGVKRGKGELYAWLARNNRPVLMRLEDPVLREVSNWFSPEIIGYGKNGQLPVKSRILDATDGLDMELSLDGATYRVKSQLQGAYNRFNIETAAAVGLYFGLSASQIINGIASYVPQNNRSQRLETGRNILILDAYNANPTSVSAALDSFAEQPAAKKMVIMGDMLELGDASEAAHMEVIHRLEQERLDEVFLVGELYSNYGRVVKNAFRIFKDVVELSQWLVSKQPKGFTILLKGSRKIRLEEATKYL